MDLHADNFKFSTNTLFDEKSLEDEIPSSLRNELVLVCLRAVCRLRRYFDSIRPV